MKELILSLVFNYFTIPLIQVLSNIFDNLFLLFKDKTVIFLSYITPKIMSFVACTSGSASQVMVEGRGGIQSPGYPYDVPEHLSCRWLLKSTDDKVSMQIVLCS